MRRLSIGDLWSQNIWLLMPWWSAWGAWLGLSFGYSPQLHDFQQLEEMDKLIRLQISRPLWRWEGGLAWFRDQRYIGVTFWGSSHGEKIQVDFRGLAILSDNMVIPKLWKTKMQPMSINFMLKPENALKMREYVGYFRHQNHQPWNGPEETLVRQIILSSIADLLKHLEVYEKFDQMETATSSSSFKIRKKKTNQSSWSVFCIKKNLYLGLTKGILTCNFIYLEVSMRWVIYLFVPNHFLSLYWSQDYRKNGQKGQTWEISIHLVQRTWFLVKHG